MMQVQPLAVNLKALILIVIRTVFNLPISVPAMIDDVAMAVKGLIELLAKRIRR